MEKKQSLRLGGFEGLVCSEKTVIFAERYSINGFKYFSELAKEYFPDLANASSASKKMRKRIKANKTLNEQLVAAYYTSQTIDVSPEMQLIIYRHWGPPHIDLPTNV